MKQLFFAVLFLSSIYGFSQDNSAKNFADTSLLHIHLQSLKSARPFLYHLPTAKDQTNIKEFAYLLRQKPTESNHKNYYRLACSLWQLNRLQEAEILFMNIINSQEKYFTTTYHHPSDASGTTSTGLYGSYTSNYKNGAALYLTKLYLEQENFTKALWYLEDAVKKYPVTYTCGTSHVFRQEEYTSLYAYCYEGMKQYDKVLDILLPRYQITRNEMLIPAVKKLYKPKEIEVYLQRAVSSMRCTFDTLPTVIIQSSSVADKWDTITYYSGQATIELFGRNVELFPSTRKDGERITKEHLIRSFKESQFYQQLIDTSHSS